MHAQCGIFPAQMPIPMHRSCMATYPNGQLANLMAGRFSTTIKKNKTDDLTGHIPESFGLHVAILSCIYIYIYIQGRGLRFPGTQFLFIVCNFEKCHVHCVLRCFVFFPSLDKIWNQFNMRTTYLGYVVRRSIFLKHVFQVLHFKVAFVETSGIAG